MTELQVVGRALSVERLRPLAVALQAELERVEIARAVEYAGQLDSYDPDTMNDADNESLIERGLAMRQAHDRLHEAMRGVLGWFEDWGRLVRGRCSDLGTLYQGVKDAKAIVIRYRGAKEQRARQAQAKAEAASRAAAADAAQDGGAEPPPAEVAPDEQMPGNVVRAGTAAATGRKVVRFRVTDIAAAARAYPHLFTLNETAAKLELKAAMARDPKAVLVGIEHWHEDSVAFSSR